jgi:hypothetical protein
MKCFFLFGEFSCTLATEKYPVKQGTKDFPFGKNEPKSPD